MVLVGGGGGLGQGVMKIDVVIRCCSIEVYGTGQVRASSSAYSLGNDPPHPNACSGCYHLQARQLVECKCDTGPDVKLDYEWVYSTYWIALS